MKIFEKERKVTELAHDYLEALENCATNAEKAILAFLSGDKTGQAEMREKVDDLEAQADEIRRAIGDTLFSGAYMPLMRGDIFGLIESIDRIPNAAEACCTFFYSEKPEIPVEFRDAFLEITRTSFAIVAPLKTAVTGFFEPKDAVDSIRELVKDISKQESEVDELELKLTVAIYESSAELALKHHLRKALDRIVHISDRAEDSADHIVLIAMKSVT